jgi:hypothetical protein
MAKVEQALGTNWSEDSEGKKCKEIGDTFERILDISRVVQDWNSEVTLYKRSLDSNEQLFEVVQKKKQLKIRVNTGEKLS